MARIKLDCKGISCPKPLVRLSKAVRELSSGDEIEIHATDPNFTIDVYAWADRTGHRVVQVDETEDLLTAVVKVA